MPRISPDRQIAHALSQLRQAIRMAREAEKALRAAQNARTIAGKGQTRPSISQASCGALEQAKG